MKAMRKIKRPPHTLRIRRGEYRGVQGFKISGRAGGVFGTRIFCRTREGAEIIRLAAQRRNHELADRILRKGG
jgi:hypothetical protein